MFKNNATWDVTSKGVFAMKYNDESVSLFKDTVCLGGYNMVQPHNWHNSIRNAVVSGTVRMCSMETSPARGCLWVYSADAGSKYMGLATNAERQKNNNNNVRKLYEIMRMHWILGCAFCGQTHNFAAFLPFLLGRTFHWIARGPGATQDAAILIAHNAWHTTCSRRVNAEDWGGHPPNVDVRCVVVSNI